MDPYNPAKKQRSPQQKLILATVAVLGLSLAFWVFSWLRGSEVTSQFVTKAVVVLAGESSVNGTVTFEQTAIGLPVTVKGDLKGLDPNSLRGFHIHQFGDLTNGCLSAGPHYNPFGRTHGARSDTNRHVGDLGNIKTNEDGHATFRFQDSQISLNGPLSILGRAVVVHTGTDDLGKGGDDESLKTGNAGGRAACGVIGISS